MNYFRKTYTLGEGDINGNEGIGNGSTENIFVQQQNISGVAFTPGGAHGQGGGEKSHKYQSELKECHFYSARCWKELDCYGSPAKAIYMKIFLEVLFFIICNKYEYWQ